MSNKKPTKKETEMAKDLLLAEMQNRGGFHCKPQKCPSISSPCEVYCPDMTCGDFGKGGRMTVRWCPTEIKCPNFTCQKVGSCNLTCSGFKPPK